MWMGGVRRKEKENIAMLDALQMEYSKLFERQRLLVLHSGSARRNYWRYQVSSWLVGNVTSNARN